MVAGAKVTFQICCRRRVSSEEEEELSLEGSLEEQRPSQAAHQWQRLLRKYWGIKRLQWLYHGCGSALQLVSEEARVRLSATYKIVGGRNLR